MSRRNADFSNRVWRTVSLSALDMVRRLLRKDKHDRITSQEVLQHPWMLRYGGGVARTAPRPLPSRSDTVGRIDALGHIPEALPADAASHGLRPILAEDAFTEGLAPAAPAAGTSPSSDSDPYVAGSSAPGLLPTGRLAEPTLAPPAGLTSDSSTSLCDRTAAAPSARPAGNAALSDGGNGASSSMGPSVPAAGSVRRPRRYSSRVWFSPGERSPFPLWFCLACSCTENPSFSPGELSYGSFSCYLPFAVSERMPRVLLYWQALSRAHDLRTSLPLSLPQMTRS